MTNDIPKLEKNINTLPGHPGCVVKFVKANKDGILYNAVFEDGVIVPFIEPKVVPVKMTGPEGMQLVVDMYKIEASRSGCKDRKRWKKVVGEIVGFVVSGGAEEKAVDMIIAEIDAQLKK